MKPVYIIASSCISPQRSFGEGDLFQPLIANSNNVLYCHEPDYSQYINPVQIRRMSRALKMGFTAALDCLKKAGDPKPQGIIVGTGKGCMTDTEQFLHSIRDFQETALNPTHFIHSTYNQINGLVALNKKINSYNVTYVHRGFSFEHALLDAQLLIDDGEAETVLVGSFDEMTTEHFDVKQQWGYWKDEKINSLNVLGSETKGTIAGEGSSFYLLSGHKPAGPAVCLRDVTTLYKPDAKTLQQAVDHLLLRNGLTRADIGHLMLGEDGDIRRQEPYRQVREYFPDAELLCFKQLCGEYDTASNFGFWLAVHMLQLQHRPDYLLHPQNVSPRQTLPFNHVLIYNNYFEQNQSLMLLSREPA